MSQRNVTVYNTVGQQRQTVNVPDHVGTWCELQQVLTTSGVRYDGMKVVVGESQVTLESNEAQLPTGEFTLFLMPQKVRSGGLFSSTTNSSNAVSFDDYDPEDDPRELTFKSDGDRILAYNARIAFLSSEINNLGDTIENILLDEQENHSEEEENNNDSHEVSTWDSSDDDEDDDNEEEESEFDPEELDENDPLKGLYIGQNSTPKKERRSGDYRSQRPSIELDPETQRLDEIAKKLMKSM